METIVTFIVNRPLCGYLLAWWTIETNSDSFYSKIPYRPVELTLKQATRVYLGVGGLSDRGDEDFDRLNSWLINGEGDFG